MEQSVAILFALDGSRAYGERVAARLEWRLASLARCSVLIAR